MPKKIAYLIQKKYNDFMHDLGIFLVLIPISVISIALFVNSSEILPRQEKTRSDSYIQEYSSPSAVTPTAAPKNPLMQLFSGSSDSGTNFDLDGPLLCDYKDEAADFTIRILNKNIYVQIKEEEQTTKVLLKDGTLYKWIQGEYTGEKITNLDKYLSLFDTFSAFLTPDMILSMINKVDGSPTLTQPDIENLKKSCREGEIDTNVFTVPSAVTFEEIQMQDINNPERFEID